ncbi:hypothetical protein ACT7V1_004166 [Salmonella enterica subsp. enterica]
MLTNEQKAAREAAIKAGINPDTLKSAVNGWVRPTPEEIRILIDIIGDTLNSIAAQVGADRVTASRWCGGTRKISFTTWGALVSIAGMGEIWKEEAEPKPQKVKRITVKELHEARELAKQYRAENPDHAGGVVVVYDRVACGWMDTLRDPHTWAPMSLAVDVSDNIWLAMGGNDDDGAARWEPLQ